MSQRRTLILVAAIAIGALASFLVWNYVGGIQDQAYSDTERVEVWVATQQITQGMSGNEARAYITKEEIPRKFVPGNAIASLDDVADQVAGMDIAANQVVLQDMFVAPTDPRARKTFASSLEEIRGTDQVTVTIRVDEIRGVAGMLVPGDYVNVMVTNFAEVAGGSSEAPVDDGTGGAEALQMVEDLQARYLYQKVRILAVDSLTVAAANSASGEGAAPTAVDAGLITMIVPAKAAQVLATFADSGNLYLSLVSQDYEPVPQSEIDISPLPAEDENQLTPYGTQGDRDSE